MLKVQQVLAARRRRILNGEKADEGFTLIELLIVVLIIGVLAAIAIPVYLSTVQNSKNTTAKDAATSIVTAIGVWETQSTSGGLPTADAADWASDSTLAAALPGDEINVWYSTSDSTHYTVVTEYEKSGKFYQATESSTVTELAAAPGTFGTLVSGSGEQ